jgi:hypothetical protein
MDFGLTQISKDFAYQSYFDSTALEKAVLDQGSGGLITPSTFDEAENVGYGLALRPESETPIAVEFKGSKQKAIATLKPGQVIFPFGHQPGDEFRGFSWGLPYGWLGGGLASLMVLGSPRARVQWPAPDRDIVIQRQRMVINAAAVALATLTVPQNWPTRFPALGTKRVGTAVTLSAAGRPTLKVAPTRTLIRLRSSALNLTGASVRLVMLNTHLFDIDSTGAAVADAAGVVYRDVDFPAMVMGGADAFAAMPQFPAVEVTDGPLVTLGCELGTAAGVLAVDLGAMAGANYLDIVRFGRL